METKIAVFKGKGVRKVIHNNEWWFVVEDVVTALTDSGDPKQYVQRMKQRDSELAKGWVQIVHTLEIQTEGGRQKMNCANTEGIFRIIQSVPSPKAGGDIAGNARKQLEKRIKRPIVSRDNFLGQSKRVKKLNSAV